VYLRSVLMYDLEVLLRYLAESDENIRDKLNQCVSSECECGEIKHTLCELDELAMISYFVTPVVRKIKCLFIEYESKKMEFLNIVKNEFTMTANIIDRAEKRLRGLFFMEEGNELVIALESMVLKYHFNTIDCFFRDVCLPKDNGFDNFHLQINDMESALEEMYETRRYGCYYLKPGQLCIFLDIYDEMLLQCKVLHGLTDVMKELKLNIDELKLNYDKGIQQEAQKVMDSMLSFAKFDMNKSIKSALKMVKKNT
ncbi:hypothetical protein ACPFT0_003785, partial [Vibrio cholerae]